MANKSIVTFGGLTSSERRVAPLRRGDPLGLGVVKASKNIPDPDTYDEEQQRKEYAQALLSEQQKRERDAYIKENGYLTIEQMRSIIRHNLSKESSVPDPAMMIELDSKSREKIFIADDNVYTRQELYDYFAFEELGQQPEDFFAQQLIGVFDVVGRDGTISVEYVAKDHDDETLEFITIRDQIKKHEFEKRGQYFEATKPKQVVKTKIFVGKTKWDGFLEISKQCQTLLNMRINAERTGQPNLLSVLYGGSVTESLRAIGYQMQPPKNE